MCFRCGKEFNTHQLSLSPEEGSESAALAVVDQLTEYIKLTPLERFAQLFLETPGLKTPAIKMFDAYEDFLLLLNDDDKRRHLENLAKDDVPTDSLYADVRQLGHRFQDSLDQIFFNPEDRTGLYELTRTYGVF